mmetsp:Transcript_1731/g.5570  ORF Transcript_1731/g.5570 Transcript_1731/m.5570 type:complete len:549 (-) Transcript_1731:153-1799(-)
MVDNYPTPLSPHLVHRQRSQNCGLVKDDVGKAPPSCYDLPPDDFVYGGSESADASGHGVRDALCWAPHVPSPPRRRGVDHQRVNREAAISHVTSARELTKFRAEHDFRLSPPRDGRGPPALIPSDVTPGYAYGQTADRPSDRMGALIAHRYVAEEGLEERYRRYDEERVRNAAPLKIKMTRAAGSYRQPPLPEPEDPTKLWKMKRFQRAAASPRCRRDGSPSPPPASRSTARLADDAPRAACSRSASLPGLPQANRSSMCKIPTLEEVLLAARVPEALQGASSDAEEETEAGSDAGYHSEGESWSATPQPAEGPWDPESWPEPERLEWEEDQDAEPQTLVGGEVSNPSPVATPRPARRVETLVKLLLTVSHELPEELNAATAAMAGCIRSRFPDSLVRVKEVELEKPRDGIRNERSRYLAWGQGARRSRPTAQGGGGHVMSPVVLSLTVWHTSSEELGVAQRAIVDRIREYFPQGVVQLRGIRPPLPHPRPVESPPDSPGQVRFRKEVSIRESPPLRYPLRPRTRDGQLRRPKPRETTLPSPPRSPWK